jgi:hypothetical protein
LVTTIAFDCGKWCRRDAFVHPTGHPKSLILNGLA